ncbi:MAG: type II secretion system protein GspL, partial [Colwellia sp.]|nr:type II secretion system protein GspL [Colwellia sp.]
SDVILKQLAVPTKSQRAMRSAVPYMLEDELAQDVEQLFFAYADHQDDSAGNNCFVAIVEHSQMQRWQSWLADADIKTKTMYVDVLAMPLMSEQWSVIALHSTGQSSAETQVLVRQGRWQGFSLDAEAWQFAVQHLFSPQESTATAGSNQEQDTQPVIKAYSALPHSEQLTIERAEEELPLALLAQHCHDSKFNLLQGHYKVSEQHSKAFKNWLWAAGIAACALLLNVGYKSAQLWQLTAQQEQIEAEIIERYKKVFPQAKRVRVGTIKSQLNRKIAQLGGAGDSEGFLAMLAQVQPAFAKVPELKPESLKFDGKRQELRLQAVASDYQHFERFKNALNAADLTVKQGAQSNQGEKISGSYSISSADNRSSQKSTKGRS